MSSTDTHVTFGVLHGPSRRFGPQHRHSQPVRSIMRPSGKIYTRRHSLDTTTAGQSSNDSRHAAQNTIDAWRPSHRPLRPISPASHLHYVGARRQGHSSGVFAFSPSRPSSRHKRHTSSESSSKTSQSGHRRSASVSGSGPSITSLFHGHRRVRSNLTDTVKAMLASASGSYGHSTSAIVSSPRKLGHQKRASVDSSFVMVQSPPVAHHHHHHTVPLQSSDSVNRGFAIPSFDLQNQGYILSSSPLNVGNSPPHRLTPSAPQNSYTDSGTLDCFNLPESHPWTQPPTTFPSLPRSERIHVHSELLSNLGCTLRWNMVLPPKTAVSGFSDPSHMSNYSDSLSKELLRSRACPGAAKIIIRPASNNPALALWMDQWGPIEVYSSDLTFQNEITVYEVLQRLYMYFQQRLSSKAMIEMPVESRRRIAHARAKRLVFEGQTAEQMEWDKPPKRVDVLALWSVFGGFEVRYKNHSEGVKLDEYGWRAVELELKLRSAE